MGKIMLIIVLCVCENLFAQRLNIDAYGGISNYQGDLQGRITFDNAHLAGGLGLSYDVTNRLSVRAALSITQLSGSDKTNPNAVGIDYRNLDFETNIKELHLALEYNLFDLSRKSVSPYAFGGLAVMRFNPYTNYYGNKVYLQPLGTEGQGIPDYPQKKTYSLNQLAIPFGGGLKAAISDNVQICLEVGFRKLFTDYLDDVSGDYADSTLLANFSGPLAVDLAYRGDEVNGPAYPIAGSKRGNPNLKDWYYITCLRVRYLFSNNKNGGSGKNKTGCPTNIY